MARAYRALREFIRCDGAKARDWRALRRAAMIEWLLYGGGGGGVTGRKRGGGVNPANNRVPKQENQGGIRNHESPPPRFRGARGSNLPLFLDDHHRGPAVAKP